MYSLNSKEREFCALETVRIASSVLSECQGSGVLCFQNVKDRELCAFRMLGIESSVLLE